MGDLRSTSRPGLLKGRVAYGGPSVDGRAVHEVTFASGDGHANSCTWYPWRSTGGTFSCKKRLMDTVEMRMGGCHSRPGCNASIPMGKQVASEWLLIRRRCRRYANQEMHVFA